MRATLKLISLIFLLSALSKCQVNNKSGVQFDSEAEPFQTLSEYNFFKGDLKNLEPQDGVLPYDLNSALFSDYAEKARFVWMPEGTSANYEEKGSMDFPLGTVLIKNFYYSHDQRKPELGRNLMETRLIVRRKDKWDALTYIWNDAQTEAKLSIVGGIRKAKWISKEGKAMELDYLIPNKNQCKSCHNLDGELVPIGPWARNLNKDFAYANGTMNQLEKWESLGYLKGLDKNESIPKVANYEDENSGSLHDRAMAYLDVNCGHCHNPHGPAHTSGLNLIIDQKKDLNLGIYKSPVATGKGSGGFKYSIVPGNPAESIMVYRMKSTDPGAMMPEIGRQLIHEEGVGLIIDWIAAMDE